MGLIASGKEITPSNTMATEPTKVADGRSSFEKGSRAKAMARRVTENVATAINNSARRYAIARFFSSTFFIRRRLLRKARLTPGRIIIASRAPPNRPGRNS